MSQTIVHEVLAKKPKRRVEWVQKRLKEDLAIQHRDSLYEVLMRKEGKAFASDINGADAMRTYNAVLAAIDLFTTKQQRHLQADTYFLRKLHRQEQEKQERLAREAKARAHEAKKAAKAAKERSEKRTARQSTAVPQQENSHVERSPKTTAPIAVPARSRSRSPLPRADASKVAETEKTRSPSPDWIPRTPPDPEPQMPAKSTGSWTTTVFEELPGKDDRAPTVVAPRLEPAKPQPLQPPPGQIFRSLDDVSTLGVKELSKEPEVDAGRKGTASSSSTEYDAFGTGPDPVPLRSPSRERKKAKSVPVVPSTARDAAVEAPGAGTTPHPKEKSAAGVEDPPPPMPTRHVLSAPDTRRPPAEASSEAKDAAGKRDGGDPEAGKGRQQPSPKAADKEEKALANSIPNGSSVLTAEAPPTAEASQAAAASKPEGSSATSEPKPDAEPPPSEESGDEENEEEAEEEDAAGEGSESQSSGGENSGGSQAPTSPAQAPGDNPPQAKAAADAGQTGTASESDSGSGSESAGPPEPASKQKPVKLEAAPRKKPILQPAKPENWRQQPAPPQPPPPPRSRERQTVPEIKVPAATLSARASQLPLWRYLAPDGQERLAIRSGPGLDAPTTGLSLGSGEVFPVSLEKPGDGGVLFLRIADGRGWVFDRKCGRARKRRARPLCVPYQVPLLEDDGDRSTQAMAPRAMGPDGPLPLDRLSSLAKPFRAGFKARKRRHTHPGGVTVDPYMTVGAQIESGEVIEVGSDDDGGPRKEGSKLGQKRQIKEQLRQQLERKQNEVQALRNKLNQLDSGQASSQLPVRRVVMRSSDDSRTVGTAEAPQDARQHDPLLDEKRQQLQAMLAKKRAMGFAQSPPAKKPTPRFVD